MAPDATLDEIRTAWRQLTRKVHPDVGGNAWLFRAVQEAWETLSDADRRARYDRDRATGPRDRNEPPADATRRRPADGAPPPPAGGNDHWRQPWTMPSGQHATVGTAGGGLTDGLFGDAGAVGRDGEIDVAARLDQLPFDSDVWIFHDVTLPGGNGNLDHIVLAGNRVVLLDTKRWRTGIYEHRTRDIVHERQYQDRNGRWRDGSWTETEEFAWRDGERFDAALGRSFIHLTDLFCGRFPSISWSRALVLSASGGRNDRYNLSRYSPPSFHVVTADQLTWIVTDVNGRGPADPAVVAWLTAHTSRAVRPASAVPAGLQPATRDLLGQVLAADIERGGLGAPVRYQVPGTAKVARAVGTALLAASLAALFLAMTRARHQEGVALVAWLLPGAAAALFAWSNWTSKGAYGQFRNQMSALLAQRPALLVDRLAHLDLERQPQPPKARRDIPGPSWVSAALVLAVMVAGFAAPPFHADPSGFAVGALQATGLLYGAAFLQAALSLLRPRPSDDTGRSRDPAAYRDWLVGFATDPGTAPFLRLVLRAHRSPAATAIAQALASDPDWAPYGWPEQVRYRTAV